MDQTDRGIPQDWSAAHTTARTLRHNHTDVVNYVRMSAPEAAMRRPMSAG